MSDIDPVVKQLEEDTERLKGMGIAQQPLMSMPEDIFESYLANMLIPDPDPSLVKSWYESTRNQRIQVVNSANEPLFEVPSTGQTSFIDLDSPIDYHGLNTESSLKENWLPGAGSTFLSDNLNQVSDEFDFNASVVNNDAWSEILERYGYTRQTDGEIVESTKTDDLLSDLGDDELEFEG